MSAKEKQAESTGAVLAGGKFAEWAMTYVRLRAEERQREVEKEQANRNYSVAQAKCDEMRTKIVTDLKSRIGEDFKGSRYFILPDGQLMEIKSGGYIFLHEVSSL